MNLFERVILTLTNPAKAVEEISRLSHVISLLEPALIVLLSSAAVLPLKEFSILFLILPLISWYASSKMAHYFALILGGKGFFDSILRIFGFAQIPLIFRGLLGFLSPEIAVWINSLLFLWSFYIQFLGIRKVYMLSNRRSLAVLLIPTILLVLTIIFLGLLFI
ncbi:MAG: YIP1 family protein [Candidatus Methanofastidiosia archaeon]